MNENRSYVFFREISELPGHIEPPGAQGVNLTVLRSIAVDKNLHIYGTPFWIEAALPLESEKSETKFRRLMIAQDTGGAIVGPARADLYFGAGRDAGTVAGRIKNPGTVLYIGAETAPIPRSGSSRCRCRSRGRCRRKHRRNRKATKPMKKKSNGKPRRRKHERVGRRQRRRAVGRGEEDPQTAA